MTSTPTVELLRGAEMPVLGLGVYQVEPGGETFDAVSTALSLGYRHIDTARFYSNERDVGRAVRESGVPRDQIFVTTKLANFDHGYEAAIRACEQSLTELGFDHVDLYLIHWPVEGLRRDSWRALVELQKRGLCRAIGVSNYTVRHLEELRRDSDVLPEVNQVELSPFLYQRELIDFCTKLGIRVEAYSPLTQGQRLKHRTIVQMAARYGRTGAQIMLRWAIQHGLIVIPKSTKRVRIAENAKIFDFEIAPEHMAVLDELDENLHTCWDPSRAP